MSSDGEDFGNFEEDDFAEVLSQQSQILPSARDDVRPSNRRRISDESDNDSIEEFLEGEADGDPEEDADDRRRRDISAKELEEEMEKTVKKKKSKYRIHIPRKNIVLPMQIEFGTQIGEHPDSSPYRIRGAMWKLPRKVAIPNSAAHPSKSSPNITSSKLKSPPVPWPNTLTAPNSVDDDNIKYPKKDCARSLGPSQFDMTHELANLPSDAFSSSPEKEPALTNPPGDEFSQTSQRLIAPRNELRQTTLFGGRAPMEERPPSQVNRIYNFRADAALEAPTHHKLDEDALKTWVFPTNLGKTRQYQFNIVRQGLFSNMLVALPTGLGKTFIAATIMLNYFRWTKDAKIIFMAPTKPLVSQQVDACFNIAGIPRSATTLLTGEINPAVREEEWENKRVFFMTPQTLDNDLRTGICNPKKIVLLVVDEAHRATGEYAYVKVIKFLRRFSNSFRVLALTATPGSTVDAVQDVIDNLEISKVEIRTEESMDIQEFTHVRKIEQIILEPSDEMIMIKDLFSKALQPLVNQLCGQNAYYNRDPMTLTPYGMMMAQKNWMSSPAGRGANQGMKGMMRALFTILASVSHGIKLLNFHGIGPFYETLKAFKSSVEDKGEKGSKYKRQIVDSPDFKKMMERILVWLNKDNFVGHPKLTFLCDTILNHFLDAGEGRLPDGAPPSSTRVIVFSEFRDSAEDIARVLNKHGPMIRASVFVGQADSKRSQGMNQTTQLETIRKFKAGVFNVIVATSIGEEGLDIGQVDLIVCYDASGSPIRMLQRMGRTGRKRAGNIVLLLMKGKEEENFMKAKDNYEQMQKMIASGTRFKLRHDLSTRIIPKEVTPVVDQRHVEIPRENTQDSSLPEPKRRLSKVKKRPPKKFHMPDGVETGFRQASRLVSASEDSELEESPAPDVAEEEPVEVPSLESVLLNTSQLKTLERTYQNVYGEGLQEVSIPEMNNQPESQRSLRPVKYMKHGKDARRLVTTIEAMNNVSEMTVQRWQQFYDNMSPEDIRELFAMPSWQSSGSECSSQRAKAAAPRKKAASKTQLPRQPSIYSSNEYESLLETLPQRKIPQKGKATKTRRRGQSIDITLSTDEQSSSDNDDAEDLEDFVVNDSSPVRRCQQRPSSMRSSSPPEIQLQHLKQPQPKKRFFEPTMFTATQGTNEDDELPDIDTLVGKTLKPRVNLKGKENVEPARNRAKRRRVVEDSDDDD